MDKASEEIFLKMFSAKTGKPIKELRRLLEEAKAEAEEQGLLNDNVVKGLFRKKLQSLIWAEKTGVKPARREAAKFKGFLIGADMIRDIKEQMRKKALQMLAEDEQTAKIAGYVDENGIPIDWRPTIRNRRGEEIPNPNYHKPIEGSLKARDFFGIAVKEGSTQPKLFVMTLWRGFVNTNWKPFVPIEFTSTIKKETQDYYILAMPRFKKGEKMFKVIKEDIPVYEWMCTALANRKYTLAELEKAFNNCQNATDKWILTEGLVDYIDTSVNPKTGSRSVFITDPDLGLLERVRVFIPKDFPLTFREWSRVLVFGIPRSFQREEEEDVTYYIHGISLYPIPGQTVEAKTETVKTAEPEDEEEGWDLWEE